MNGRMPVMVLSRRRAAAHFRRRIFLANRIYTSLGDFFPSCIHYGIPTLILYRESDLYSSCLAAKKDSGTCIMDKVYNRQKKLVVDML